jgi:Fic family protein
MRISGFNDMIMVNMLKLNELLDRHYQILDYLADGKWHETSAVVKSQHNTASGVTLKRDLRFLTDQGFLEKTGAGRATKYRLTEGSRYFAPVNTSKYFAIPQDERGKNVRFNFEVLDHLKQVKIFNIVEKQKLSRLVGIFQRNIKELSSAIIKREFERVTIDLSWKSSAIEGNTYSLLETESLFVDGIPAHGKTRDETTMLLNHKKAIEFIRSNSLDFKIISVAKIEDLHTILSQNLGISKNIRKRTVGITGTNYRPLDNEYQIREALEKLCTLINEVEYSFAKALLAILFISYIQPFEDGNKRTARLLGNAILLAQNCFPLSFRSVDVTEYKISLLLFYETNNLSLFKSLFITQAEFSAEEYFR